MTSHFAETSKPNSPIRPKHQVTRSITEASPPSFPKLHKAHHYHHHQHLHRKDDKATQSAHPNLQPHTSIDGTKSEGVTPEESRAGSRGTSVFGDEDAFGLPGRERRTVREGEVKEEREKGVLRAAELRNVLMGLNSLSNNTTRRLDNTYYAVLEKLSVLQGTIISLKELASMTKQLNDEFKTESEEVVKDVETQLNGFEGFQKQEKRIEALQERVMKGREKIKALGERVDVVKERVDGWLKAEGEWQERTRKRLRMLWILMSVVAAAIFALVVFPAITQGMDGVKGMNGSSIAKTVPNMDQIRSEARNLTKSTIEALEKMRQKHQEEKLDDDPRLRLFDEL